ncbi:hypothetical protein NUW54_g2265 [Trametes sanguinea]|uniref:Uncharacterized protein n=1 Tax=Trametes sanguinea TaxID=158606 RepID=A0ACC1Q5Q1_9APHY|nr:hypothetical protein NUW54_g2265 [Trametes sanguinea]
MSPIVFAGHPERPLNTPSNVKWHQSHIVDPAHLYACWANQHLDRSSRHIHAAQVNINTSGYGQALAVALGDPISGLYATNATAPLAQQQGLRDTYKFGLYSYCGYLNGTGVCSNTTAASRFQPFTALTSDMLTNYTGFTTALITQGTFIDSPYLGNFTNGAYYLIIIGSVATALALFTGLLKHTVLFFLSTTFAVIGALALLIGATIWTVIIKKAESINDFVVGHPDAPRASGHHGFHWGRHLPSVGCLGMLACIDIALHD